MGLSLEQLKKISFPFYSKRKESVLVANLTCTSTNEKNFSFAAGVADKDYFRNAF